MVTVSRPVRMRHHGTPRAICGIEGCTAPAGSLNCTPSSLASEDSVVEAVERAWAGAVDEGSVAHKRNVVEAEVPDGSIGHTVGTESHQSAYDCSGEDIVLEIPLVTVLVHDARIVKTYPVVVLINGKSTSDQTSSENRCV